MQIRNRLTLQFTAIVAVILLFFSFAVYHLADLNASNVFENRLTERALNTAKMLLEVDEISEDLLKTLRKKYLQTLPHEFVRIYDHNKNLIYKDDTTDFNISRSYLDRILKENEITSYDGNRMIIGHKYMEDGQAFIIVASAIDIYGQKKMENLLMIITAGYIICIVLILISGRMFAKQALKPISRIISQVETISASNLSTRLAAGKEHDEIAHLASTFNSMFSRLESAFEMQKNFVSNVSHELRTPLTSIRGEIEVTLMKERTSQDYKETLNSVLDETRNLSKLSNNLLELANAGIDAAIIKLVKTDIDQIIARVTEEALKRHSVGSLKIDNSSVQQEDVYINCNEDLLISALINIVDNAFKYSSNRLVEFKVFKNAKGVVFSIRDFGIGMTQRELENVFLPFFRSSNVNNIPGHGIGLPLARKIINQHSGEITIESEEGKGTLVSITLPVI